MSIDILFDPIAHKYTNRRNDPFISVTTLRDLYIDKFSDKEVEIALRCEAIGKNRMHPKHLKYRYKTATQLLEEWSKESTRASINGNEKHEYLETEIKIASSFKSCSNTTSNRLFTVSDILENESIGILDLTVFDNSGVKTLYPQIYTIIENFIKAGWRIFSEVCTYHLELMVSGLIDIILVKGNKFVI